MNRRSFLGAAAAAGGSVATPKKVAGHHRVGSAQGAETDFRNIEWGPKAKEILRRTGAGAVRALRLSPGPHLFVDWRLVKAGGVTGLPGTPAKGSRCRCGTVRAGTRKSTLTQARITDDQALVGRTWSAALGVPP